MAWPTEKELKEMARREEERRNQPDMSRGTQTAWIVGVILVVAVVFFAYFSGWWDETCFTSECKAEKLDAAMWRLKHGVY